MADPALPPSDVADTNDTNRKLNTLARSQQLIPVVIPFAVIGGTPRADGYHSVDSTTYVEMVRSDCYATNRYLNYDLQVTGAYGGAPTSIDWQIVATFPFNPDFPATTTLATGSGVSGTQFSGSVDLFTTVNRLVLSEYLSLRLSVKRTGGSGEAAGIRLVAPMVLRSVG